MAAVIYSCPFKIGDSEKSCVFSSEDSRLLINHCLEWHSQYVGVCHEPGCEGKIFRSPDCHWEDHHFGDTICDFCDPSPPIENYNALRGHLRIHHQQQMGYAQARVPPASKRLSLENTMKLFVSAPSLQFIQLRPNFGLLYDSKMNRTILGAEILYPEVLNEGVARPRPYFKQNLTLPPTQVTSDAIQHLGFEAGHIIPCDDWKADFDDFNATFDNSNLVAMNGHLNKGPWKVIEKHVQTVAKSSVVTLALTVCHYDPMELPCHSLSKLVHIPNSFSKILYVDKGIGSWLGHAFNLKNDEKRDGKISIWKHKRSFDELKVFNMDVITLQPVTLTWDDTQREHRCKDSSCQQAFYDYQQYTAHKDTHKTVLKCSRCRRPFASEDLLVAHKEKCFLRCQYCDKPFPSPAHIINHENTHTGERPFKCNVDGCHKAYTTRGHLTEHKRTHGDTQLFCPDPTCTKVFTQTGSLNRHRFIHYDIKRYSCSVCGHRGNQRGNLEKHQTNNHLGAGTVIESEEWKELAKRLKQEAEEAAALAE